jgi:hypothetical protein
MVLNEYMVNKLTTVAIKSFDSYPRLVAAKPALWCSSAGPHVVMLNRGEERVTPVRHCPFL